MLNDENGFSFLELMIVLAVMGIVLTPMIQTFYRTFQAGRSAQFRQKATYLSQDCMAQLQKTVEFNALPSSESGESISCDGSTKGESEYNFKSDNSFSYETMVSSVNGGNALKQIRIRVHLPGSSQSENRCITSSDCSDWDFSTLVAEH